MGAFTMPSLPGIHNLPTVKSFLNTSPPLVYPKNHSPGSTPRRRNREGTDEATPTRARPSGSQTLVPSPSIHDVQLDWERVDRSRRSSLSSVRSVNDVRPVLARSDSSASLHRPSVAVGSPGQPRPTHRRSQSVIPKRVVPPPQPTGPMGRLFEISRDPQASSSAISLPTLIELGDNADSNAWERTPASPVPLPRSRRPSHGQRIANVDDHEDGDETDASSVSSSLGPPQIQTRRGRPFSSVPPPNAMAPPPLRPPTSPSSWSLQDVGRSRTPSVSLSRRSSVSVGSSTSLSDVEVVATWSFPSQPVGTSPIVEGAENPADRLRDRLKRLSELDTTSLARPSPSVHSTVTPRNPAVDARPRLDMLGRSHTIGSGPSPSRHRHTHSSPISSLPIPAISVSGPIYKNGSSPLLPPPKPRRPTTSRLRHPSVLSMPVNIDRQPSYPWSNFGGSGSSPGSLLSDGGRSTSGSEGEVASPTGSVVSLPPIRGEKEDQGFRFSVGLGGWAKQRVEEVAVKEVRSVEEICERTDSPPYVSTKPDQGYGARAEEEQYLSLDDI